MSTTPNSASSKPKEHRPKDPLWKTFLKAELTQLGVQVRLLNGKRQTWPYAQLVTHELQGGVLRIWFSHHVVTVHGRHLEDADAGLRLQSLVYLEENGTRQEEALGEPEIPEDQPAIDSIEIAFIGR